MSENARLEIEERDGAVMLIILDDEGDKYAILPPDQAVDVGEALVKHAYHIKTGSDYEARQILTAELEKRLLNRVTLMIRSMTEKKEKYGYVAQAVIGAVLREVT